MFMKRQSRKNVSGFTLFEVMLIVLIIGILSVIALVNYNHYANRTKMVETIVLVGALRKEIETDFNYSFGLPDQISGAFSSVAGDNANIYDSDTKVLSDSYLIDSYWYYKNGNYGWVAVDINPDAIYPCETNCTVHLGFRMRSDNSDVDYYCGVWDADGELFNYPYYLLPSACKVECVKCELGL
jgi:type II secretory pathway pseudopilin PulG